MIIIGIDPGSNTGLAVIKNGEVARADTLKIHVAMREVEQIVAQSQENSERVVIAVEDARQRRWFVGGRERAQGAGSIKRDCSIWAGFLIDLKKSYPSIDKLNFVAPKNISTKMEADAFKKITGFTARTSNHARDAALLALTQAGT